MYYINRKTWEFFWLFSSFKIHVNDLLYHTSIIVFPFYPLIGYVTNVCWLLCLGVFTVSGILDSFIYHSQKAIKKKIEIGKFSWWLIRSASFAAVFLVGLERTYFREEKLWMTLPAQLAAFFWTQLRFFHVICLISELYINFLFRINIYYHLFT